MGACGVRGHVDQPVHPAVKQELHGFLLPLRIASAVADDDGIIVLPEDILHGRDDGRDERVAQLGNDNADDAGLLGLQAAGYLIGDIVQLFDCGLNQYAVFFPDSSSVEILGDGREPETGLTGQILHR